MKNIAIIGAGMTSLAVSSFLRKKFNITIFEKSRGVGGRMSTRRAQPYLFNHGAQYFKINTEKFRAFLRPLFNKNIIKPWNANYVVIKNKTIVKSEQWENSTAHYVGYPKMNSVIRHLADDFSINLSCKIERIEKISNEWFIYDAKNSSYGPYDWIIFTIPPKQVTEILKSFKYLNIIKKIKMRSCFSLMLGYENMKSIKFDVASFVDEDISWFVIKRFKLNDYFYSNILINSTYNYAERNELKSREKIGNYLINTASTITNVDLKNYKYNALHFWRYAMSEKKNKFGSFIDNNYRVIVCGDWCMKGNVEGAFLSGQDAAEKILKYNV